MANSPTPKLTRTPPPRPPLPIHRYKGTTYRGCTADHSENARAWCATAVDAATGEVIPNRWEDCRYSGTTEHAEVQADRRQTPILFFPALTVRARGFPAARPTCSTSPGCASRSRSGRRWRPTVRREGGGRVHCTKNLKNLMASSSRRALPVRRRRPRRGRGQDGGAGLRGRGRQEED